MNSTKNILLVVLLLLVMTAAAQDCTPLRPSGNQMGFLAELLNEDEKQISSVCQVAVSSDYLTVRVDYSGFGDGEQYRIVGQLLNANRRRPPALEMVDKELRRAEGSAELTFRPSDGIGESGLAVRYLKVSIVKADDPVSGIDFGGISLTGTNGEFELEHVFGAEPEQPGVARPDVTVSVTLTPVGAARTIKQ